MQNNKWLAYVAQAPGLSDVIRLAVEGSQANIREAPLSGVVAQSSGVGGSGGKPPSQTGGSGGPSMEARVAVLENDVKHIKENLAKLSGLPADVAELKVKVDNLPSKDWVDGKLTGLLVKGGIVFAIFNGVLGAVIKLT